jgi:mono/diheme cytochrome c family protein
MKRLFGVLSLVFLSLAGLGWIRSVTAKDPEGFPERFKDPESVRLINSIDGQALYQAYCAVCHGIQGRGEGPMAASLKVAPSDLTRIAARHGGTYPDALTQRIIAGEERLPAGHGTRDMPVWGPVFSQVAWDQDLGRMRIHNLSNYIRRLQER